MASKRPDDRPRSTSSRSRSSPSASRPSTWRCDVVTSERWAISSTPMTRRSPVRSCPPTRWFPLASSATTPRPAFRCWRATSRSNWRRRRRSSRSIEFLYRHRIANLGARRGSTDVSDGPLGLLLLLGPPLDARGATALGQSRLAPLERALQPDDGASPTVVAVPDLLGLRAAAAARIRARESPSRGTTQPALPVLDPHRGDRPTARADRTGLQHALAPSRAPRHRIASTSTRTTAAS